MSQALKNGRVESLLGLASILEFVATYFFDGPTPQIEKLFTDETWLKSLQEAGLVKNSAEGARPLDLYTHKRTFSELLRVPQKGISIPPFEQTYLRGRVTDPKTTPAVACKLIYDQAGYELEPYDNIPSDFIGHQMRFLAEILKKEAEALANGDEKGASNARSWRLGFLSEHCLWWGSFSKDIGERQKSRPFILISNLLESLQQLLEQDF